MAKKAEAKEPVSELDALVKENEAILAELEILKEAQEKQAAELAEQKDSFLRTMAEYDNYRKRTQKEKEDAYIFAKTDTVSKLLPAMDNFERSLQTPGEDLEEFKKGVDMIYRQLTETLTVLGVEAFGETGEEFSPESHNAVMHREDENLGTNVVAEVFQKGYRIGDKIIRPAVVAVAN